MAKIKKIERGEFIPENFDVIATKLNEQPIQSKKQNIRISLSKENAERFKTALNTFILKTGNVYYMQRKDFLRMILLEMSEEFKKTNDYYLSEKTVFKDFIKRAGRRWGDRAISSKELTFVIFGSYDDDTLRLYDDVCYSLAKKENMGRMSEYSTSYFFVDVLNFIESKATYLYKKYKINKL